MIENNRLGSKEPSGSGGTETGRIKPGVIDIAKAEEKTLRDLTTSAVKELEEKLQSTQKHIQSLQKQLNYASRVEVATIGALNILNELLTPKTESKGGNDGEAKQ